MPAPLLAALLVIATPPPVVEKDGVRIEVKLMSHIYSWEVTNLGAEPITGFEIEYHKCYQHHAPDGWTAEADGRLFVAQATHLDRAIHPGRTETFSARTSSGGNALGSVTARVALGAERQRTIVFDEVWGPVEKPRAMVALVAILIGAVATAHTLMLIRRRPGAARGP